ncbi:MAG: hypothetical protein JEY79_11960 [Pseudodesulfovibrio sp.]|nr:hypothetical protein [Pseudodesulfovibrio sp.]
MKLEQSVRLSELSADLSFEILYDNTFERIGSLGTEDRATLATLYDAAYLDEARGNENLTCVITTSELAAFLPERLGIVISDSPEQAFYDVDRWLADNERYEKNFDTVIGSGCDIQATVIIPDRNVRIGNNVTIAHNVVIHEHTDIGDGSIIRAGSIIGSDGFEKRHNREEPLAPHTGGVSIGNHVEVQALCAVERGMCGVRTRLDDYSRIGSQTYISHNVLVGKGTQIAPGVSVCGSTTIGEDIWIAPGAIISNGLTIGDGAFVTLGETLIRNLEAGHVSVGGRSISKERYEKLVSGLR